MLALTLLALAAVAAVRAAMPKPGPGELVLVIQPILSEEQTHKDYQPLAEFIERTTGRRCVIGTLPNFIAYWEVIRRHGGYDLAFDAAHFTDYRIRKFGFTVLAKIPGTVSYSLVVPKGRQVLDPMELTGKTIATLGPPSVGAVRLSAMFPNPTRQPAIVEVDNAEEGMELVVAGRVHAAILPTPLVSRRMAQGGGLAVVMTTEPMPNWALSAAPRLDPGLREKLRAALLNADKTEDGKRMLQGIGFPKFDPATPDLYAGQGNVLRGYWGY